MAKGVSIKFRSYQDTIPRILDLVKLEPELKKHSKIIIKPYIKPIAEQSQIVNAENSQNLSLSMEFVEQVLRYCLKNKNPVTEVFIAEGADGADTMDLFREHGYVKLAERYGIGLIDLNTAEVDKTLSHKFLKFSEIMYPKVLKDSFIISLAKLAPSEELGIKGSLANMLGAFPSDYYKGFFSSEKKKIKKHPIKYSIHDILLCKMPNFALIDASEKGSIFAGMPFEIDKQASKLLGIDWKNIGYLRLIEENHSRFEEKKEENQESTTGTEETTNPQ